MTNLNAREECEETGTGQISFPEGPEGKRTGPRQARMKSWWLALFCFYMTWLVLMFGLGFWRPALRHWPMSVVMLLGSIVAGSTPMGGGTVAFPVLVLLFGQPETVGRTFGMAIQAVGMISAMIFIVCRRIPIQTQMLFPCAAGSALGLLLGTFYIAPLLAANTVKLLFSCIWMSFAILTLAKNREICALIRVQAFNGHGDLTLTLAVGVIGGVISSILGTGIEMVVYTVLVLRYRCDLKSAIPTAVCMGGITSLMGIGLHGMLGDIEREVFYIWLAASPVVILGAPLGSFLATVIPRRKILYFVSLLCVLQFLWTLEQVSPNYAEWIFVCSALVLANIFIYWLYRTGRGLISAGGA